MQKKLISVLSFTLMGTSLAIAGGDILPVENKIIPIYVEDTTQNSGIYIGLGISDMGLDNDLSGETFNATGAMIQAGYQFNNYIAIEGRYTKNIGDLEYAHGHTNNPDYNDYPGDFSNLAIYLKPMYSFNNLSLYALLGYGEVTLTSLPYPTSTGSVDRAEDGFQWGLGMSYNFTDTLSLFVDYVNVYDDKGFDYRAQNADIVSELWTLGVTYRF